VHPSFPGFLIALGLGAGSGLAAADTIRVYNWPEYIAADTIDRFEAETGIEVVYETFASNEVLNAVVTLGSTFYDVVVPTSTFLDRQVRADVYQPLDRAQIPNLAGLDADLVAKAARADPDNEHGAIYLWGTSGLGFNPAMVAERLGASAPTDSWALLFDPANAARLADCGITLLDSGSEVVPLALAYLGLPPDSTAPEHLAAAEATLAAIRPHLRGFDSETYMDGLADGSLCLALGWSGDVIAAREDAAPGIEIDYVVPREGTAVWFDMLAIPVEAPNPRGAHAFINFLLRPDVIAGITNSVYFPNAVRDALPLIDAAIRQDPAIYPDASRRGRLFPQPAPDTLGARDIARLWQRVRSG
jgi:putrescine transport system substrate-binding protein